MANTPSPPALALHTTSPELGLAIYTHGGETRHQTWLLGHDLATHLHVHLAEFMAPQTWQDLGFLAVAIGPGSFTSTRIGVVTARTLAQQLGIPLYGISTLAAIAEQARSTIAPDWDIAVQLPARRGEVFGVVYRPMANKGELIPVLEEAAYPIAEWDDRLAHWDRPYQSVQAGEHLGATVTSVLALAQRAWHLGQRPHWAEVVPFYGQHPVVVV